MLFFLLCSKGFKFGKSEIDLQNWCDALMDHQADLTSPASVSCPPELYLEIVSVKAWQHSHIWEKYCKYLT
jgi:hypothetical protein